LALQEFFELRFCILCNKCVFWLNLVSKLCQLTFQRSNTSADEQDLMHNLQRAYKSICRSQSLLMKEKTASNWKGMQVVVITDSAFILSRKLSVVCVETIMAIWKMILKPEASMWHQMNWNLWILGKRILSVGMYTL